MPSRSLIDLVLALLEQLPEESSPVVIVVKSDRPPSTTSKTNGHPTSQGPVYDPASVFILEAATVLALRDTNSIAAVGRHVADALHAIVRNAAKVHPLMLSRVVYYLLRVLYAGQVSSITRTLKSKRLTCYPRITPSFGHQWSCTRSRASSIQCLKEQRAQS